ncbi:uncharacterized protein VICG_00867 [Vittaforma corneae ATCC 50505]|uniref:AAA+ ATPase domain-containing protein n=1 Tax=Vittaforma corneae (strain ATCC 50505) TaxID=993615 RepID=L2GNE5_VITCO|nr:uncharacterized protein VICG_00867 [Vittaforma corneae ATCC 50505]ELA42020.1 hypothetical protein VICG_00867 [Vittaforma corneae ATCC 50505]
MLFVDKYSPKTIEDVLGNQDVIQVIKDIKDDFPHLLFTGPPGTGKTTLAHLMRPSFETLELNASDERGIDTIRTTLKSFCHKNVPKKLVILDECDHLTAQAQQALRRLMEITDTKFILICNQISQIIEPIQSRCAVLKFERIPSSEFKHRLREICDAENIKITDDGLDAVMNVSYGDIRASLGCLQGISSVKRVVDDDFIYKLNGIPNVKILESIISSIETKEMEKALETFHSLWNLKFESTDILDGLFKIAKNQDNFELLKIIGKYQLRINEGVNSKVQFYSMFNEISKLY